MLLSEIFHLLRFVWFAKLETKYFRRKLYKLIGRFLTSLYHLDISLLLLRNNNSNNNNNNNNNNTNNNNNNNNNPVALKFLGLRSAGNSYFSRAGEALFTFGWQSPTDGASRKILMVVQPYSTLVCNETYFKKEKSYYLVHLQVLRDAFPIKE